MDRFTGETEVVTPTGERVTVEFYIHMNEPEPPSNRPSGVVRLSGLHPRIGYAIAGSATPIVLPVADIADKCLINHFDGMSSASGIAVGIESEDQDGAR